MVNSQRGLWDIFCPTTFFAMPIMAEKSDFRLSNITHTNIIKLTVLCRLSDGGFRSGSLSKKRIISFRRFGEGLVRINAPSGVSGVSTWEIAVGKGLSIRLFCLNFSMILFTGVT